MNILTFIVVVYILLYYTVHYALAILEVVVQRNNFEFRLFSEIGLFLRNSNFTSTFYRFFLTIDFFLLQWNLHNLTPV